MNAKLDGMYNELSSRIDDVLGKHNALAIQVAQIATSIKQPSGQLPGKPETNPKDFVGMLSGNEKEPKAWKQATDDPIFHKDTSPPKYRIKILLKKGDPGRFTMPCVLGDIDFEGALADSGANVNVITKGLLSVIGITRIEKYTSQIVMVDSSSRTPIGVIKDFPVVVNKTIVPTDFVVIESVNNGEAMPFMVFGRPFLNTVGALLNFKTKIMTLTKIDNFEVPMFEKDEFCEVADEEAQFEESMDGNDECHFLGDPVGQSSGENGNQEEPPRGGDEIVEKGKSPFTCPPKQSDTLHNALEITLIPLGIANREVMYAPQCAGGVSPFVHIEATLSNNPRITNPLKKKELLNKTLKLYIPKNQNDDFCGMVNLRKRPKKSKATHVFSYGAYYNPEVSEKENRYKEKVHIGFIEMGGFTKPKVLIDAALACNNDEEPSPNEQQTYMGFVELFRESLAKRPNESRVYHELNAKLMEMIEESFEDPSYEFPNLGDYLKGFLDGASRMRDNKGKGKVKKVGNFDGDFCGMMHTKSGPEMSKVDERHMRYVPSSEEPDSKDVTAEVRLEASMCQTPHGDLPIEPHDVLIATIKCSKDWGPRATKIGTYMAIAKMISRSLDTTSYPTDAHHELIATLLNMVVTKKEHATYELPHIGDFLKAYLEVDLCIFGTEVKHESYASKMAEILDSSSQLLDIGKRVEELAISIEDVVNPPIEPRNKAKDKGKDKLGTKASSSKGKRAISPPFLPPH